MSDAPYPLFSFVTQVPLHEKPSARPQCPYCGGRNIRRGGKATTLLWGGDGTVDGDPNHTHEALRCDDCGRASCRETKRGNVWYTGAGEGIWPDGDGRILAGFPSCFESYTYTCVACGGDVRRRYTALDGATPVTILGSRSTEGGWVNDYRTFYDCTKCHATIEVPRGHWYGEAPV